MSLFIGAPASGRGKALPLPLIPSVTSKIFRIYITANNGHVNTAIAELKFYDALGAQVSTAGGTVTAISQFDGAHAATKAFDGNTSSFWASANSAPPHWLQISMASDITVSSYSITGPPNVAGDSPKDFQLQVYDSGAGSYITVDTRSAQTGWTSSQVRSFTIP